MLHPHTHPLLDRSTVAHGFFGRAGGVSTGIYAGLNLGRGSADDPQHVDENRRRVAAHFGQGVDRLCTVHQVHSPDVVTVTAPMAERPQADALVTNRPGLILGILTADCGPVLFADAAASVIGAAHAGWKGAHGGVLENTVAAMEKLGARRENIVAVLGPAIAQQSYEVGAEFIARFTDAQRAACFIPSDRPGYFQFDLPKFIAQQLAASGIAQPGDVAMDTRSNASEFFSYRRTTLAGESDYGRQISAIMLLQ